MSNLGDVLGDYYKPDGVNPKCAIVNKAIEAQGLIPHTDKHGKISYIAQVTHHDCVARGEGHFFKFFEETQPYTFPENEIIYHWFHLGGGPTSEGLYENTDFIIETVYDKELQMAIP